MNRILLATLILTLPHAVRAETKGAASFLEKYDKMAAEDQYHFRELLSAFYEGMSWTNTYARSVQNQPAVFCPPLKIAITSEQVLSILREQAAQNPEIASSPTYFAVFKSIRNVFPCN